MPAKKIPFNRIKKVRYNNKGEIVKETRSQALVKNINYYINTYQDLQLLPMANFLRSLKKTRNSINVRDDLGNMSLKTVVHPNMVRLSKPFIENYRVYLEDYLLLILVDARELAEFAGGITLNQKIFKKATTMCLTDKLSKRESNLN